MAFYPHSMSQSGGSETAFIDSRRFTKELKTAWTKTLGHMYGSNMQDEAHKAMGKPNIPGMGVYESGKKKGQPRKIRFRKCRANGKAIIPRVKDSDPMGFRAMSGVRLPIWDVNSNFTVDMGFKARGRADNPTVLQENGGMTIMDTLTKGEVPSYYNRRNVSKQKREAFKKKWEAYDDKYVGFDMSDGFINFMKNKMNFKHERSAKNTYHPTMGISLNRQKKKFPTTLNRYIRENLEKITTVSITKV